MLCYLELTQADFMPLRYAQSWKQLKAQGAIGNDWGKCPLLEGVLHTDTFTSEMHTTIENPCISKELTRDSEDNNLQKSWVCKTRCKAHETCNWRPQQEPQQESKADQATYSALKARRIKGKGKPRSNLVLSRPSPQENDHLLGDRKRTEGANFLFN
jgi:hypothetical protein